MSKSNGAAKLITKMAGRALVINAKRVEYPTPVTDPGEDSRPFCQLHLGIRVAKENTMQSSAG